MPLSRHPARTLCCLPLRVMALGRCLGDPENTVNTPTVTGRDPPLMSPVFLAPEKLFVTVYSNSWKMKFLLVLCFIWGEGLQFLT